MLFGKAADRLKYAKSVALLYLGGPYYPVRLLEEYNNIKEVNVFTRKEFPNVEKMTEEQYLLKNVVQAFADKLYVEMKFLNKN